MRVMLLHQHSTIANINKHYTSQIKGGTIAFNMKSLCLTTTFHTALSPSNHKKNRVKSISSYIETLSDTGVVDKQKHQTSIASNCSSPCQKRA